MSKRADFTYVFPLFFSLDEKVFWKEPHMVNYIVREIRLASQSSTCGIVCAVSDDYELVSLLNAASIRAVHSIRSESDSEGELSAVMAISDVHDELVICNIRQPGSYKAITSDVVANYLKKKDKISISCSKPRDHPCQLYKAFLPTGLGFIHLLSKRSERFPHHHVGRPCVMPFGEGQTEFESGVFWDAVKFRSGEKDVCDPNSNDCADNHLIYRREDGLVDLYFPKNKYPQNVLGISFFEWNVSSAILVATEGGCRIEYTPLVVSKTEDSTPDSFVIVAKENGQNVELAFEPTGVAELLFRPQEEGLFYFPGNQVDRGPMALLLRAQTLESLWRVKNGRLVRSDTNKEIFGRQNFPDSFSFDGSVVIGRSREIVQVFKNNKWADVCPLPVEWEYSKILNAVDAIQVELGAVG